MSYYVLVNESEETIRLSFKGDAIMQEHLDSRDQALSLCEQKGYSKLLVDLRNIIHFESLPRGELFNFAQEWAPEVIQKIKFAVVLPEDIDSQKQYYFITEISKIHGVSMQTFYEMDKAKKWLAQQ